MVRAASLHPRTGPWEAPSYEASRTGPRRLPVVTTRARARQVLQVRVARVARGGAPIAAAPAPG